MNTLTPQVRWALCSYSDPRPLLEQEVFDADDWLEVKGVYCSDAFLTVFQKRMNKQTTRTLYTLDDLCLLEFVLQQLRQDIDNGLKLCYTITTPERKHR